MPTLTRYQNKSELRAVAKNIAKNLDLKNIGEKIIERLKISPYYRSAENIFAFYPTGAEPDISNIFDITDKNVFIPRIYGLNMKMFLLDKNCLIPNKYGIFESHSNIFKIPEENDLILVPALGGDLKFNRLGHGGGFYDRFLENTNAFKIMILPEKLLFDDIFPEKHDVPCDGIFTEKNFYLRET